MDRITDKSLSVAEAKARLRRSVAESAPFRGGAGHDFLRRHPLVLIGLVLAGGFILGKSPAARRALTTAMLLKL